MKISAKSLLFRILPFRKNVATVRYVDELSDRMKKVQALLVRTASEETVEIVKENLPGTQEYDVLRQSLAVRDIGGLGRDMGVAAAVVAKRPVISKMISTLPADRVVLIIGKPNPRVTPIPDEVYVLRLYNPWTVDTIPYLPEPNVAKITYKAVTKVEVDKVRKMRIGDLDKVKSQLQGWGIKVEKPELDKKMASTSASEDLTFLSLRTEFGLQGYPARPHWRVALRYIKKEFPHKFFTSSMVEHMIYDPNFTGWEMVLPTIYKIGMRRVKQIMPFQDKVRPW